MKQYEQSSGCGRLFNVVVLLGCGVVGGIVLCVGILFAVFVADTSSDESSAPSTQPTRRAATATTTQSEGINATATGAAMVGAQLTRTPRATATSEAISATATPELTIHIVAAGETLGVIAAQYEVTVQAIVAANGIEDPNALRVGQELIIPTDNSISPTPVVTSGALSEAEYADWIRGTITDLMDALEGFTTEMEAFGDDENLYFDTGWRTQVAVDLGIMRGIADTIEQTEAPERYSHIHDELLNMAPHLRAASIAYAQGLDDVDADKVAKGNEEIRQVGFSLGFLETWLREEFDITIPLLE